VAKELQANPQTSTLRQSYHPHDEFDEFNEILEEKIT
jgi:hypothetical protein